MEIQQGVSEEGVTSLNGLTGDVTLAAGSNISLTPVGNTITIASTASGNIDGTLTASRIPFALDSNTLDDDSNFIFNDTTKKLGLQVTDPQSSAHIAANIGTTINDVVTGSVSLITETPVTVPSPAAVAIPMPVAGSGGSASYVDAGAGTAITANGSTYDFKIYPCLDIGGGVYYKSQNFETVSAGTDPNDSQGYNIAVSWGSVSISGENTAYFVEYDINSSGSWQPIGVFLTTSEILTTLVGSDPTTAWGTFYTKGVAPTAYTGGSAQAINIGSGGIPEANNTILLEVDSVLTYFGVKYVSGTPTSGSFSDSGLVNYNAEIVWTDNGNSTDSIARISVDSGSTWFYQFTGSSSSPYVFTSLTNDAAAQARWGQTYTTQPFNFYAYNNGTTPSGNNVWSVASGIYGVTVTDTNFYILKHSISGLAAVGKLIDSAAVYGLQISATPYYDVGYTTWGSGPNATPNTYGFTGADQNRNYRAYGYNSTSAIYSQVPLTLSTSSSGGFKYISGSVTYPAGITDIKLTRQINGGGYTAWKSLGGATTFTDDTTDTSWSGSTPVITPTQIIGSAGRFDRESLLSTDSPILEVVAVTASGGLAVFPKISYGRAASNASAPTYFAHTYSSSTTGYLHNVTGRIVIEGTLGGTQSTLLGNSNVFNNANSSTVGFTVKSLLDSSLITTSPSTDTVGFGQAIGSDHQTTVQIQPARSTDAALVYIGHASQSDSTALWKVQTSAGTINAEMTLGGWMRTGLGAVGTPSISSRADTDTGFYFNGSDQILITTGGSARGRFGAQGLFVGTAATSPTAKLHLGAGSATVNTAPLKFTTGALLTSPENGTMEFLSPDLTFTPITTRYQIPLVTGIVAQGDIIYGSAASIYSRLPKDTGSTRYLSNTGSSNNPAWAQIDLTNGVTGILPISRGGTGSSSTNYASLTANVSGILPEANGGTGVAKSVLADYFTDTTVGGAEADIYTLTTSAGQLATNGQKIIAEYGGNFVTVGTELTQLKVYFGGTAIWDSTGVAPTTGTTSWRVYVEIIRVSSTVIRYTVSLNTTGASGFVYCGVGELTGLTLSNTNILKITGTSSGVGSGSGDIVGKMGYVNFVKQA